jgi:hypothetical protein
MLPTKESEEPRRQKDRKDKDEPMSTKSITDIELPRRVMPNTDRLEPKRTKLLKDTELPTWR